MNTKPKDVFFLGVSLLLLVVSICTVIAGLVILFR